MTQLEQLIQDLCPNGVKMVKLGDVVDVLRGKRLTKSELSEDAQYNVYHGGLEPLGKYHLANREADTVMVINVGASAGTVGYSDMPFWSSDGCFCLSHSNEVNNKYLYYYLQTETNTLVSRVRRAGIPTLDSNSVLSLQITLPPLAVQSEIVRILDKFTLYKSELAAELAARCKQYEHYRNQLLTFDENTKRVKLGEIGEFIRGNGLQKKDFTEEGFPCIHYGQIHTYYGTYATKTKSFVQDPLYSKLRKAKKGDLVIATTSEDAAGVCKAVAWLGDEEVAISGDAYIFRHNQNPKYIAYLFQTDLFYQFKKKVVTGTKVIRVSGESMQKFEFPLPPLEVQEQIVAILDRFDALCNDIKIGLPAEIELRQKQYEHYRDKLLTFEAKGD